MVESFGRLKESSPVLWYSPLGNPHTDHPCGVETRSAPRPQFSSALGGSAVDLPKGEQKTKKPHAECQGSSLGWLDLFSMPVVARFLLPSPHSSKV